MSALSAQHGTAIQQILYISFSVVPGDGADLAGILQQSRHNNALDGVTGLLWSDGKYFLQVLEGPAESAVATFARIMCDRRHRDLRLLSDWMIPTREFGDWTMVHRRSTDPADLYDAKMRRLLSTASEPIKQCFFELIARENEPPCQSLEPPRRPCTTAMTADGKMHELKK